MPGRPIECTISKASGITISGNSDEIISYEIWNLDRETCILLCLDESDFLNEVYSLNGDYLIKLNSINYTYTGYLSTTH